MSAFSNIIEDIARKKAGMFVLVNSIALDLEGEAKINAPWTDRTGHARQSLNGKATNKGSEYRISLSHGVEYGEILEEGSKPHIINYWED